MPRSATSICRLLYSISSVRIPDMAGCFPETYMLPGNGEALLTWEPAGMSSPLVNS